MSTEIRKRGRPKKVVEEMPISSAEKTPKPATSSRTGKASSTTKAASTTTSKISAVKSNGAGRTANGKKEVSQDISPPTKSAKAVKSNTSQAPAPDVTPPPPTVIQAIAIEESKILKEIAQTESKKTQWKQKPITATAHTAVLPPIQEAPSTASFLQPTNTLAMGFPIPSHQSSTHNQGLPSHCLPWLPNPSSLRQAAYLSTTTPMHAAKRKLPSMKDVNKFVVTEQSSRGGRGSGAAQSRVQQAIEEAKGGDGKFTQPGDMPKKYRPALRRVQAIIVALPIVIVTSYMLYERLVLGVEPKKAPRVPSGSGTETTASTGSSGGTDSS